MIFTRAMVGALLAGVASLATGLGTAAHADPYPDGRPPVQPAVQLAPQAQTQAQTAVDAALATVTAPASGAVQAAMAHGFYWQLTLPQPVVPGSVLLAHQESGKTEKKRAGRSDEQFFEISRTGSNDVPEAALSAYKHAAASMARTDPSCHLSWTLLAAIGRVESNHGRFGGAVLGADGVSRPAIVGPELNGAGPFAAIADSDGGKYDGDKKWDRAVGQMQFLPSTWRSVARDGDGDGKTDPFDIDDSALGAAVYLCGAGDLSTTAGMARAAFRYNHSDYYVALVLSYAKGYETGVFALPSPPPAPGSGDGHPHGRRHDGKSQEKGNGTDKKPAHTRASDQPVRPAATTRHRPTPSSSSSPSKPPKPVPPKPSPSGSPTTGAPRQVTLQGPWNVCGNGYCVGGTPVDLGPVGMGAPAPKDLDGDGTVENRTQELAGLVGADVQVVVEVVGASAPGTLIQVNGTPWR